MKSIKYKKSVLKKIILQKTDGVCASCGRKLSIEKVTIEHFVPKYRGGEDDIRNLLPLCKNCNKQKGSRVVSSNEYYTFLKEKYKEDACKYQEEWHDRNGN
ncbi:HNH endonuclease [Butyrivibrio fibrisolvens]|uniref:HNH endonuclease n=1 Tax=Butyrivibrio fibrisolvens TaxID=831 RepID=UPI0003F50F58|nr:HNH endonuclease signature motif containing protein [Butyrivibrio fibrisolvens]